MQIIKLLKSKQLVFNKIEQKLHQIRHAYLVPSKSSTMELSIINSSRLLVFNYLHKAASSYTFDVLSEPL